MPASTRDDIQSGNNSATRTSLVPLLKAALLISLTALLTTFLTAITGEKTTFLYKEQLHLSASQLGLLGILTGIPAYLQPFMGACADLHPLFGFHRRSYYLISCVFFTLGYLGLTFLHSYHLASVVFLLLIAGSFGTFINVIVNSVIVSTGNRTGMFGRLRTLGVFVPYILSLTFTSHLGGYITQHWTYPRAYGTAALLSLLWLPLIFLIEDSRVSRKAHATETPEEHKQRIELRRVSEAHNRATLKSALKTPGLWALIGFIFYLIVTPGQNLTYYFSDGLHLSKQFIGDLGRWTAVGAMLGMIIFALASRRLPVISLVIGAWLMDCALYPISYHMHDASSVQWMSLSLEMVNTIYNLCLWTLGARACPPGIEGTIYGLVLASIALAARMNVALGSAIYDYFGPANHHSITYGWNASVGAGLVFTLGAGLLIPFMPAWAKSRQPLSANTNAYSKGVE